MRKLVLIILGLAIVSYFVMKFIRISVIADTRSSEVTFCWNLQTACENYAIEYGRLPPASDNQKLAAALLGENSRHIPFLSVSKSDINAKGEFIDQWGTPYLICFTYPLGITVVSAGPDKVFGTMDDVRNQTSSPRQTR